MTSEQMQLDRDLWFAFKDAIGEPGLRIEGPSLESMYICNGSSDINVHCFMVCLDVNGEKIPIVVDDVTSAVETLHKHLMQGESIWVRENKVIDVNSSDGIAAWLIQYDLSKAETNA